MGGGRKPKFLGRLICMALEREPSVFFAHGRKNGRLGGRTIDLDVCGLGVRSASAVSYHIPVLGRQVPLPYATDAVLAHFVVV